MAQERLANLGYGGFVKEATKGTALTPTDYFLFYDETLSTDPSIQDLDPVYGNKFKFYSSIPGLRKHSGEITMYAEPNTTSRFVNTFLTQGSPSGSGPYTRNFTLSATNPKSGTVDISTGNVVKRFFGVEVSKISPDVQDNEVRLKYSVSALGSFQGREVASVATNVVTLKTDYDPNPTRGLVASDLIRFHLSGGTTVDATVTSFTATTVTVSDATGVTAGDFLTLRPATPSTNLLDPFQWAKTEFRFADTAANALTATHTPLEQDTKWELVHNFEDEAGAHRSGSYDPAALVRTQGEYTFSIKKFFDTPEDIKLMNNLGKTACVVRMFSGATNQYEMRITFNQLVTDNPLPQLKSGEINYAQISYHPNYKSADGQGFSITMVDGLATV